MLSAREHKLRIYLASQPKSEDDLLRIVQDSIGGEWNGDVYRYQTHVKEDRALSRDQVLMIGEALQKSRLLDAIGAEIVDEVIREESFSPFPVDKPVATL